MQLTDEERLLSLLNAGLRAEFYEENYPSNTLFFPDSAPIRDLKFFIWVLNKYEIKEQALKDAEVYLTMSALQKK